MVQRRAPEAAGLDTYICNHTWRGTGITTYLENGGTPEEGHGRACVRRIAGRGACNIHAIRQYEDGSCARPYHPAIDHGARRRDTMG